MLTMAAAVGGCPDKSVLEDLIKPPTAEVRDLHISGLSGQTIDLIIDVDITNPNPIALTLSRVEYNLTVAGRQLAAGATETPVNIKASGVSAVEAPVSVAYNEIKNIYAQNLGADYVDYTLAGKVYVKTPVGDLPIPYKESGKMPVVRPPLVAGVGIKVNQLSLAGAEVTVRIQLQNPNGYPLTVKSFAYKLSLEGQDFAAGSIADQAIAAHGLGSFDVPVKIDFMSGLSWALSLISNKKASYALDFDAEYLIDTNPVTQHESSEGAIDFTR